MNLLEIVQTIHQINNDSGIENPVTYYLNGGCYIFAKQLQEKLGGKIWYLTVEHHFVVELNTRFYDSSGNVTKQYINSKRITESEFLKRPKLVSCIHIPQ